MIGLGYRRDMADWDMSEVEADFFEVVPENWLHRDRTRLHELRASGRPVHLHGVSLNLGGTSQLNRGFLLGVRNLMSELRTPWYSDHLAASGDAHQLHDLFPIPFTAAEARRVADRILAVQDVLGTRIAIENPTWYTNVGDWSEAQFLQTVAEWADCRVLLDVNNIDVNRKNHGGLTPLEFARRIDPNRVTYLHVAGHEWDGRFDLYMDTHSQPVASNTAHTARQLQAQWGVPILLEWDNDVPDLTTINHELSCLRSPEPSLTT